jgi:hypothetical protein
MSKLTEYIKENLSPVNLERLYDDMLDECYSFKSVGGIFAYMSPSRVLAEVDPTAYRCGMSDYEDGLGLIEIGSDYYNADDCEEQREALIDEMESEIDDLQNELDALDDEDLAESPSLKRRIAELESERDEVKKEAL